MPRRRLTPAPRLGVDAVPLDELYGALPITSTHRAGDFEFAHRGGAMRRRPGVDDDDTDPGFELPDEWIDPD